MEQVFKVDTVSNAAKAKRLLQAQGIKSRITKTGITNNGCAWGIAISGKEAKEAARLLRLEGIRYEAL